MWPGVRTGRPKKNCAGTCCRNQKIQGNEAVDKEEYINGCWKRHEATSGKAEAAIRWAGGTNINIYFKFDGIVTDYKGAYNGKTFTAKNNGKTITANYVFPVVKWPNGAV